MPQKAISVKVLAELRNKQVSFVIGYAESEGYYLLTAMHAGMRITLNTDQQNMITFLETALEKVRRGQGN